VRYVRFGRARLGSWPERSGWMRPSSSRSSRTPDATIPMKPAGYCRAAYDQPTRFIPMVNAARSPTFYEFDSADLLRLYREMDDRDEVPAVIYHSHTATEAYPSRTDIAYASEPDAHYLLVSTRETGNEDGPYELRSFHIVDGVVSEDVVVVD